MVMNPTRPTSLFVSWLQKVAASEAEKGPACLVACLVGWGSRGFAGRTYGTQWWWWWWVFNNALPRLYNYLHPADCSARPPTTDSSLQSVARPRRDNCLHS